MTDPVDSVKEEELRRQLLLLRANYGSVIDSHHLGSIVKGFKSQKGIYKPSGSPYALWIRETLAGPYPDMQPEYRPDGSWTYQYSPEGRRGHPDMSLDTNRAMLRCMQDRVPVGVLRQKAREVGESTYEVLGLAFVESFDGTHFKLRGEPIEWEAIGTGTSLPKPFEPFEQGVVKVSRQLRQIREARFGVAVRKAYHEKCSLCEVGYRVRGKPIGLEAAHIIPVSNRGTSADVRNGLLLCRNHHVLFDEFAWTPDEDLHVLVADDDQFRRSAEANCVLNWEGKRLPNLPSEDDLLPAAKALSFHLEQFERTW